MCRLAIGIPLSLLPRRWRNRLGFEQSIPWERASVLSGVLESLFALGGLATWYSHSVTTWASEALDSALNNVPTANYSRQELGLSAFVLWLIHPQTWFIGYFFFEGMVRMVAAISTEQVFGTLPLAVVDWCYGKATERPPEGDALHVPSGKAQVRSLVSVGCRPEYRAGG